MRGFEQGQLDIFTFLTNEMNGKIAKKTNGSKVRGKSKKESKVPEVKQDTVDEPKDMSWYLKKGEKIISLLRDKATKSSKIFKRVCFLDAVNLKSYHNKDLAYKKQDYLIKCIKAAIVDPTVNQIIQEDGSYKFDPFIKLFGVFGKRISIKALRPEDYGYKVIKSFFRKEPGLFRGAMEIRIADAKDSSKDQFVYCPMSSIATLKRSQSGGKWTIRGYKEYITCADAASYFARFIILCLFRQHVQSSLEGLSQEQLIDNTVYNSLVETQQRILQESVLDGVLYIDEAAYKFAYVRECLNDYEGSVKVVKKSEKSKLEKAIARVVLSTNHFNASFVLSSHIGVNDWDFESVYNHNGAISKIDACGGVDSRFLTHIFEEISEEYREDEKEDRFRRELDSEYAKSYQTKKNIPDTYLKAMIESRFNDYFGYVEFDEDTDLKLMEELSREFTALATHMNWGKNEEVSLRFRKLGHHKAGGLYFSTLKCLCVDVRQPSSMAHEYFHMIDYTNGALSRGNKFRTVLQKYRVSMEKMLDDLPSDSEISKVLRGKTKYNLSYYLQPTEVFARCGEMYLVRRLGINNSLLSDAEGFAYPKCADLEKAYFQFFDELLNYEHIGKDVA